MADSAVIREFLVALGFKVDQKGLKNFNAGVEQATKGVIRLVSTIQGAALSVGAGVSAFASKLERLYFVSQRTGAAATSLKAFEYAARNLGVSSEAAFGTVENLAKFLRNNPAGEGYLATIGVQTRDANGELRDTVDILADLGNELGKKDFWLANQYGQILGIDENLLLAMRNGDFGKFMQQYRQMSKTTGLDKAAEDSHAFMIALRDLGTTFENFGVRVQGALLHKVGPQLERFKRWFDENSPAIADRVAKIAEAVLSAAAAMGPPLGWILDRFIELDAATDGWSTKILLLIGAFKVLGGFQIISGIWKMVAAVRALGAANAAAAAAGAAGAGAGGAAAGGAAGILSRFLPWLAKAGGAAALLFHSGGLNEGEEAELARRRGDSKGPTASPQRNLAETAFGNLIAKGEGDYNSVNRGAKGGYKAGTENLEGMTVAEVMRAQQEGQFNAAGRYQIIKTTLADAVKKLGLTGSEKFDRGLQDRIFSEYLVGSKRSAIKDYLTGASDNIVAAMQAAAREWASVADPTTGKSFYDGVGNNRASISVEQLEQALRNTRAAMTATPTVYAQRAPGGNSVQLEQRTEINVYGVNDAAAAGREVSREQGRLNGDLVRNLQGAVS
ncbi:mannosyl-glycoprotein endo-beta-N-acetylglucosamidase [Cupriavidus gilardii]|uniref:mannosyl-glycoprotein endo-beta-N-acetylglucosamidase n=1 Tax=Cupriavidus gilardii TaxID=82541 RepID=UPI0021C148E0|nr:mannosyl-glycoprotein endo-beta-N-acetylglucosamidase [Cupriavidus gilardii]MCT9017095.1 mannosyl-glycoprotein endo-beta-N-acetylglucosamidase [Cupriavidus gilardii]MCT9056765.1 mannosyl-glycoprotein endo-beta-N-acetylglucosamidase [Cupriavidus gilardii]